MTGKPITLYCSDQRGNEKNAVYPYKFPVSSSEEMAQAAQYDHVCAEYLNNHRKNDNFIQSDCLAFDLDNTHSENPADWKDLDDVKTAFPGVPFYAVPSRNHMKAKNGKAARPKYHLYFPINPINDRLTYEKIKMMAYSVFPEFDTNAKDAARFFFGVESAQASYIPEGLTDVT